MLNYESSYKEDFVSVKQTNLLPEICITFYVSYINMHFCTWAPLPANDQMNSAQIHRTIETFKTKCSANMLWKGG